MHTNDKDFFSAMHPGLNAEERAKAAELQQKMDVARDAKLAEIAEKLLGIRREHADPIYTQHPVMAGVLRQALLEAFHAGAGETAAQLLHAMMERVRKSGA